MPNEPYRMPIGISYQNCFAKTQITQSRIHQTTRNKRVFILLQSRCKVICICGFKTRLPMPQIITSRIARKRFAIGRREILQKFYRDSVLRSVQTRDMQFRAEYIIQMFLLCSKIIARSGNR